MLLSREELCKQSNGKCKGSGVEMNLVSKWTWCIWGQKGGCCGWSRVRGKAWKRGDEAEEEGRVRSKSDRKLLEDLKQGSWEVIIYILIKALTYILKRKAWLCGEQIVGGQTQNWGDQGGDNGRSSMTDAGVWVEGFSSKAATGPHIAFVTIRKKSPIPSGGSE